MWQQRCFCFSVSSCVLQLVCCVGAGNDIVEKPTPFDKAARE